MRRETTALLAVITSLGAGGALAAAGTASAAPSASAAGAVTVKIEKTSIGKVLVTGSGAVIYLFTRDTKRGVSTCQSIAGCSSVWPPLLTSGRPVAGSGARASLLGTITHGSGQQVTYAGHPLYGYSQNSNHQSVGYVGTSEFGGVWDAVSATGAAIK